MDVPRDSLDEGSRWSGLPADALAVILNTCGLAQSDVASVRLVCQHWRRTTNSHLAHLAPSCASLEQLAEAAGRFPFLTVVDLTRCDTRLVGHAALCRDASARLSGLLSALARMPSLTTLHISDTFSERMGQKHWAALVCSQALTDATPDTPDQPPAAAAAANDGTAAAVAVGVEAAAVAVGLTTACAAAPSPPPPPPPPPATPGVTLSAGRSSRDGHGSPRSRTAADDAYGAPPSAATASTSPPPPPPATPPAPVPPAAPLFSPSPLPLALVAPPAAAEVAAAPPALSRLSTPSAPALSSPLPPCASLELKLEAAAAAVTAAAVTEAEMVTVEAEAEAKGQAAKVAVVPRPADTVAVAVTAASAAAKAAAPPPPASPATVPLPLLDAPASALCDPGIKSFGRAISRPGATHQHAFWIPDWCGALAGLQELHIRGRQRPSPGLPPGLLWLHAGRTAPQLVCLVLTRLSLGTLPEQLQHLTGLTRLVAQDCSISHMPRGLASGLSRLEHLDLSINGLASLPPDITALTALEHLDLQKNKLQALPPDICRLSRLTALLVSNNQLRSLPDSLAALTAVRHLSLSYNWLGGMPRVLPLLCGLPNLQRLELACVSDVRSKLVPPRELRLLSPHLTHLDLAANNLSPANCLGSLKSLESLVLSDCGLLAVPPCLRRLAGSLRSLDLSHNSLSELPAWLRNFSRLRHLSIAHNRLSLRVPPAVLEQLPLLKVVDSE